MNLTNKYLFALLVSALMIPAFSYAQEPGDLDATFSGDGIVTTAVGNSNDQIYDMAITADDKIIAAGQTWNGSNYDIVVIRYNSDGSLDNSFSGDGIAITTVGSSNDYSEGVAVQSDGKIVVSGYYEQSGELDLVILRFNTNGTLDVTFDGDGKKTLDLGPGDDMARDIQVQTDGKLVVCGSSFNGSDHDVMVARFNTNGSLDATFNNTGYKIFPVGANNDFTFQLEFQPDGKIVLGGYITYNLVAGPSVLLVRLNSDGSFDNSFDGDGISLTSWGTYTQAAGSGYALELQSDGKIILAGSMDTAPGVYTARMVVSRYTSTGSFDQSFANNGLFDIFIATTADDAAESINDIAIQSDGKIVATGSSFYHSVPTFIVLRITTQGTFDNTFGGGDGYVFTNIGSANNDDVTTAIELQADGKIVVGGQTFNGSNNDVALARYLTGSAAGDACATAPTGLFADNISSTKATLHWTAVTGAVKYKVQYRKQGTTTWISANSTSAQKTLTGLTASSTYQYRVKTACSTTQSPWSSMVTFTTSAFRLSDENVTTIQLYPNPVSDFLNVAAGNELNDVLLNIYDVNGRMVHSQQFSGNAKIDVSDFTSGIYMVELRNNNSQVQIEKVMVE